MKEHEHTFNVFQFQPSRELAQQTYNQIKQFKAHLGAPPIRELLVVGGVNVREQVEALKAGIDIVVATPGRLEDLISTGSLLLRQCRFFILDEADGNTNCICSKITYLKT